MTTIVWDFDGTLADTLTRNLEITREIVLRLTGRPGERIPALRDVESYGAAVHSAANWRELYVEEFELPYERTIEAAGLWTELHGDDREPPELFPGVREVVAALGRHQGIVSQNGRSNIVRALEASALRDPFEVIVADEDLPFHRQKPAPDGLLQCAEALHRHADRVDLDVVLYVGDHPVDVECVRRAARAVEQRELGWQVYSVGAEYGDAVPHRWVDAPDFTARQPADLLDIVREIES